MSEQMFYGINGVMNESTVTVIEGKMKVQKNSNVDKFISEVKVDENITAKFYLNNVRKQYIINNDKLPILYTSVDYYRARFGGSLFVLCFYFKLNEHVKNISKLLNKKIKGKFKFEIVFETYTSELDVEYEEFTGNENVIDLITKLLKSDDMRGILDDLSEKVEVRRRKQFPSREYKIPKATITLKDLENL